MWDVIGSCGHIERNFFTTDLASSLANRLLFNSFWLTTPYTLIGKPADPRWQGSGRLFKRPPNKLLADKSLTVNFDAIRGGKLTLEIFKVFRVIERCQCLGGRVWFMLNWL